MPASASDFKNDSIREVVNGDEMGVSFKAWLARDVKQTLVHQNNEDHDLDLFYIELFWEHNFYQIFK